jgi:hypothetical protein
MEDIENELKKIDDEMELLNKSNETQTEEKAKPKRKGQTRERMMELHKIRSEKARLKREEREELKAKEEEVKNIMKEKINTEYEEAQKIKEALEERKAKKTEIKEVEKKEVKHIYKTVSRDILKDKYLEEAKRRVMMDLFS